MGCFMYIICVGCVDGVCVYVTQIVRDKSLKDRNYSSGLSSNDKWVWRWWRPSWCRPRYQTFTPYNPSTSVYMFGAFLCVFIAICCVFFFRKKIDASNWFCIGSASSESTRPKTRCVHVHVHVCTVLANNVSYRMNPCSSYFSLLPLNVSNSFSKGCCNWLINQDVIYIFQYSCSVTCRN